MTPSPLPAHAPPPPASSGAIERIVALALAAILVVLTLVLVDLSRTGAGPAPLPFDFENPLLLSQPGACVEVIDTSAPERASVLQVRPPGAVLRPYEGPRTIPGFVSGVWDDAHRLPPYLVCDSRPSSSGSAPPGSPPPKPEPIVYPLNGFGMPLETYCVPRAMRPATVHWNGRTRAAWQVELVGYVGEIEGPWVLWIAKDVPVLGTMKREHVGRAGVDTKIFVPSACR